MFYLDGVFEKYDCFHTSGFEWEEQIDFLVFFQGFCVTHTRLTIGWLEFLYISIRERFPLVSCTVGINTKSCVLGNITVK